MNRYHEWMELLASAAGRWILRLVLLGGLLFLASNAYDEHRGQTSYSPPGGASTSSYPHTASLAEPETNFRGVMIYNWCCAIGMVVIGSVGLSLYRWHDRMDPFAQDFPWPEDGGVPKGRP